MQHWNIDLSKFCPKSPVPPSQGIHLKSYWGSLKGVFLDQAVLAASALVGISYELQTCLISAPKRSLKPLLKGTMQGAQAPLGRPVSSNFFQVGQPCCWRREGFGQDVATWPERSQRFLYVKRSKKVLLGNTHSRRLFCDMLDNIIPCCRHVFLVCFVFYLTMCWSVLSSLCSVLLCAARFLFNYNLFFYAIIPYILLHHIDFTLRQNCRSYHIIDMVSCHTISGHKIRPCTEPVRAPKQP